VFISYKDSEALEYATEAKRVFEGCGYATWVWHCDRRSTVYVFEEIEESVRACDFFLYICTQGSHDSWGQRYERNMALNYEKIPTILTFSPDFVSGMLKPFDRRPVSSETFSEECQNVAEGLRCQEKLHSAVAKYHKEGEPVESA